MIIIIIHFESPDIYLRCFISFKFIFMSDTVVIENATESTYKITVKGILPYFFVF